MSKALAVVTIMLCPSLVLAADRGPKPPKLKPVAIIVQQSDSPIHLTNYRAEYNPPSTGLGAYREGINHDVTLENVSGKMIVAYEIALVSFDVFNEFMGRLGGISTDALPGGGQPQQAGWRDRRYRDFAFMTGVAYVSRVRFVDGTIWNADQSTVLAELRKIEASFDPAKLKDEAGPVPQPGKDTQ